MPSTAKRERKDGGELRLAASWVAERIVNQIQDERVFDECGCGFPGASPLDTAQAHPGEDQDDRLGPRAAGRCQYAGCNASLIVAEHPVEVLPEMKRRHEASIRIVTAIDEDRGSHVVRYAARIGSLFNNSHRRTNLSSSLQRLQWGNRYGRSRRKMRMSWKETNNFLTTV